jgi:hypothetical protein
MNPVGNIARTGKVEGEFIVLNESTARPQGIAAWTSHKSL